MPDYRRQGGIHGGFFTGLNVLVLFGEYGFGLILHIVTSNTFSVSIWG